ncbi:MAG TPA: PfkB family carbohydrate kinase, partial [Cyclobacteriaceae bacterium]|nr:PfkB family carbohydrate kinase [Cyclobacteriaceae bacterium]
QEGLTTSFDPQWDPSEQWDLNLNSVFSHLDVFLPNESELMKLTGHENLDMAISALKGSKTTVVIKMGNKGSISLHEDKLLHIPPFLNKEVVDAIGAGDSFNAGFVAQFLRQASLDRCQEFGNLIGAISTTAPGGTGAFKDPENIMGIAKEKFGYDANKSTD